MGVLTSPSQPLHSVSLADMLEYAFVMNSQSNLIYGLELCSELRYVLTPGYVELHCGALVIEVDLFFY